MRERAAVRAARLPFHALMFFTFVMLIAPQNFVPALAPLHLALVAAGVAAIAHVADRMSRGRPLTVVEPEILLALLLFGLGAFSVPTSYWPGGSVQTLLTLLGKSLFLLLLLANILVTAGRVRALVWLLTVGSTVPAVAVVKDYLQGDLLFARVRGYQSVLMSNPNDVALTLNIILPLAVGLAMASRGRGPRLALAAVIALGAGGVVVTFSRAGFLFLTTTLVLYLVRLKKGRLGILLLLVLCAVLMLTVPGFVDRIETIVDVNGEASAHARWLTMKSALQLLAEYPVFGVGIGQSMIALNDIAGAPRWSQIHNLYLQIAVDIGLPALVVFLMLFYRAFRSAVEAKRAWHARGADLFYLAQGLEISLIGFAVAAMFYPIAYHFFFYYLLGLAIAVKRLSRRDVLVHTAHERPEVARRAAIAYRGLSR